MSVGSSCNAVIEGIRSSLSSATLVVNEEYSSPTPTIHFGCGRLKYSNVQDDWSVAYQRIQNFDHKGDCNNQTSSSTKKAVPSVILARLKSISKKCEIHRATRNSSRSFDSKDGGISLCHQQTPQMSRKRKKSFTSGHKPTSVPTPTELARCLFREAEFISYLMSARREVEASMETLTHNENDGVNINASITRKRANSTSKGQFWPRNVTKDSVNPRPINLQPLQVMIKSRGTKLIGDSSSENDNMINIIDECINSAHTYTLDLIKSWSCCWQMLKYREIEHVEGIVENRNHNASSQTANGKKNTFKQKIQREPKKGGEMQVSISSEAGAVIDCFVRDCLESSVEDKFQPSSSPSTSSGKQKSPPLSSNRLDSLAVLPPKQKRKCIESLGAAHILSSKKNKDSTTKRQCDNARRLSRRASSPSPSVLVEASKQPIYSLGHVCGGRRLGTNRRLNRPSEFWNTSGGKMTRSRITIEDSDSDDASQGEQNSLANTSLGRFGDRKQQNRKNLRGQMSSDVTSSCDDNSESLCIKVSESKQLPVRQSSRRSRRNRRSETPDQVNPSFLHIDGGSIQQLSPNLQVKEKNSTSPKIKQSIGEKEVQIATQDSVLNNNQINFDPVEVRDDDAMLRKKKATVIAAEDLPTLPWVPLSHVGHVSDYHGYNRRFEHFSSLQFGPIDDIRRQIGRTLVENNNESDEEVTRENQQYEKTVQRHEVLAKREKTNRAKQKEHSDSGVSQESMKGGQNDISIMFHLPHKDDGLSTSMTNVTKKKFDELFALDESEMMRTGSYRFFEKEDSDIFIRDEESEGTIRKRKSRSAEIAAQKKTSLRVLNEMLHTLDFIEEYNKKSRGTNISGDKLEKGRLAEEYTHENGKESADDLDKMRGENMRIGTKALANDESPAKLRSSFVPLSSAVHLEEYKELQERYSSFHSLEGNGDIEQIRNEIQSIVDNDNLLEEFFQDKEYISEEKILSRSIRGYSRRADQEKIEKKNFEEEQKLRQREFNYYRPKSRKSQEEIEWKEVFTRPIRRLKCGSSLPKNIVRCKCGQNCLICRSVCDDQSDRSIHFPSILRVRRDVYVPPDIDLKGDSTETIESNYAIRLNLASSLKLLEIYHTLGFIQSYNKGLIVSKERRR